MATQIFSGLVIIVALFTCWQLYRTHQRRQSEERLEEDERAARRLPLEQVYHTQEMEREKLRILNERHAHELQLASERHTLDLQITWEKHQLDKHLALTRIQADAKGHYPYVIHPEQGYQALPNVNIRAISQRSAVEDEADDTTQAIPALIEYRDVKASIPQGHALVGISARGLETREDSVRALVWVVGSSGVGKTNTVSLRVDDDYERGNRFLAACRRERMGSDASRSASACVVTARAHAPERHAVTGRTGSAMVTQRPGKMPRPHTTPRIRYGSA